MSSELPPIRISAKSQKERDAEEKSGAAYAVGKVARIGSQGGSNPGFLRLLAGQIFSGGAPWMPWATAIGVAGFSIVGWTFVAQNAKIKSVAAPATTELPKKSEIQAIAGASAARPPASKDAARPSSIGFVSGKMKDLVEPDEPLASAASGARTNMGMAVSGSDGSPLTADAAGASPRKSQLSGEGPAQTTKAFTPNNSGIGKLSTAMASSSSRAQLTGGAGLSSGIGGQFFDTGRAAKGRVQAMSHNAPAAASQQSGLRATPVGGKGSSFKRLNTMNGAIRPTVGLANAQQASAVQGSQWTGEPVRGGGGVPVTAPSKIGDGGGWTATDAGGPVAGGNGSVTKTPETAPAVGAAKNVTPWQGAVNMAGMLLTGAGMLLLLASVLSMQAKANPTLKPIVKMIAGVAAGLGAAAIAIGMSLMNKSGQQKHGMMFMIMGGIITAAALYVLLKPEDGRQADPRVRNTGTETGNGLRNNELNGRRIDTFHGLA
ncbi:MAG: hypothetical protein HY078_15295 [Elusimicrobia bacterium]|nr:hypothetical protein [Elusimicrobiota bacterium]